MSSAHQSMPEAVTLDGKNRTWTWAEYNANEQRLEKNRYQPTLTPAITRQRTITTAAPTEMQLELFEVNPTDYNTIEKWLSKLPRKRQREHFRKVYLREYRSVKNDGSIGFAAGNKQRKHANQYLRELLNNRLDKVMSQYDFSLSWLELNRDRIDEYYRKTINTDSDQPNPPPLPREIMVIADELKPRATEIRAKLPFYLITEQKLEEYSRTLADLLMGKQFDFIHAAAEKNADGYTAEEERQLFLHLYQKQGEFCANVGFPIRHWERFCEGKLIKAESIDVALAEVACDKYWSKRLKREQKRQVEHIAIACGEVQRRVAPYISNNGFREFNTQCRKNFDFIKSMIIENADNPDEQADLLDMYLKSTSNPAVRRIEMMTRLRGIEEWSEENGQHGLFLTLTAPSAYHAQLYSGAQNPKWNGASPRQTHSYLNGIWAQFRSLLAKRGIPFNGMRVAEPHHDSTPHWHILFFVKKTDRDEVVRLFKAKALELNGDEQGAKTHRAKVDDCDPEKGSATGYISKYISKNIEGYALDGEVSDEIENLSLKDNSRRATAWARLWGIRQFQFFGTPSIGVWRELRRLTSGDINNKEIEKLRIYADMGESAAYMQQQGGIGAKRADQLAVLAYKKTGINRYGKLTKKIIGISNQRTNEVIVSRKKKWVIKRRQKAAVTELAARSAAQNGGLARPWTCVSNCNRSENEQMLKRELIKVMGTVNDHQFKYFLTGKKLFLTYDRYVRLKDGQILIEKPQPKRYGTASGESSRLQRLRAVGRQLHS